MFDFVKSDTESISVELKDCMQNSLRINYPKPANRDSFWKQYNKNNIEGYIKQTKREDLLKKFVLLFARGKRFAKRCFYHFWRKIR